MLSLRDLRLTVLSAIVTGTLIVFLVHTLGDVKPETLARVSPPQADTKQTEVLSRQVGSLQSIVEQMKAEMTVRQQQQQQVAAVPAATIGWATTNLESGPPDQIARLALLVKKLNAELADAGRRVETLASLAGGVEGSLIRIDKATSTPEMLNKKLEQQKAIARP